MTSPQPDRRPGLPAHPSPGRLDGVGPLLPLGSSPISLMDRVLPDLVHQPLHACHTDSGEENKARLTFMSPGLRQEMGRSLSKKTVLRSEKEMC